MEVGDFVRTNAGNINKIVKDAGCCVIVDDLDIFGGELHIAKSDIVKIKPNITSLIQVGDYVNGERVIALEKDVDKRNIYPSNVGAKIFTDYELQGNWYFGIQEADIKSIVTKEMYSSVEYRVENN